MKRKLNSNVYDIYFESKWESDREWIFSVMVRTRANAYFRRLAACSEMTLAAYRGRAQVKHQYSEPLDQGRSDGQGPVQPQVVFT